MSLINVSLFIQKCYIKVILHEYIKPDEMFIIGIIQIKLMSTNTDYL